MVREGVGMKRKKEGRKLITLGSFTFLPYTLQDLGPVPASPVAFLNLLIPSEPHSLRCLCHFYVSVTHLNGFDILQSCRSLDSCGRMNEYLKHRKKECSAKINLSCNNVEDRREFFSSGKEVEEDLDRGTECLESRNC